MNQRAFDAGGKPGRRDEPKGSDAPSGSPVLELARTQAFLECTRAILRAPDEAAIVATVCQLLVHPGVYAEACVTLFERAPESRRSSYAGSDKPSLTDPERFWAVAPRKTALEKLMADPASAPFQAADGDCVLRLTLDGHAIGALAVVPGEHRAPGADEIEQLLALAEDVVSAVSRLRESTPQRSLALSERRLRETVEHAGVGITRIDMNGRFLEVNQKFCEMVGYTREELIGRATREVTVPEDYGAGAAFRAQAQLGRARMHIGEKRYQRKDGSPLWVRRTMSPAFDENGKVRDVISIVEDITDRKRIEKSL
ncbi:MAG TPA: PAS domain S-box protein, partial [Burkholderiales bacterium]|nr:PAS domain S-box protein [Burkholderiales bacterium]